MVKVSKERWHAVAFDCGNSSIRVVDGQFDGEKLLTKEIIQVPQNGIKAGSLYYWDILHIFEILKQGLVKAYAEFGPIDSVGISTWGIDFGRLGENDELLGNPLCYRNHFGELGLSTVSEQEQKELFFNTGIQCDKINSLFQLAGYQKEYGASFHNTEHGLLIPDLLNFLFTGEKNTDSTIASTTQIYDVKKKEFSSAIYRQFQLPQDFFYQPVKHGEIRGFLKREIAEELHINQFPFISVPAHDTAAAVVAVPVVEEDEHFVFISSGTWSLIGTERKEPLINEEIFESGFTNEAGAFETITLLKNSAGLFIIQRLKAELEARGDHSSWDEIIAKVKTKKIDSYIDPNDSAFFNPTNMEHAINEYLSTSKQDLPKDIYDTFYIVYHSLTKSYKEAVDKIEEFTKEKFQTIYIVGGGGKNDYLNQLTADATLKTVITGSNEATSIGNLGIQLLYQNQKLSLTDIRRIIHNSTDSKVFYPKSGE